MKKLIYLFFLIVPLLVGCKKEKLTACQEKNIGYIGFNNKTNDAYDIWIDNKYYKQQPANSYTEYMKGFPAGKVYRIRAVQVSGYLFSPTRKDYNITLNMCDEKMIVIK